MALDTPVSLGSSLTSQQTGRESMGEASSVDGPDGCHVCSENWPHGPIYIGEAPGGPGRLEEPAAIKQQVLMGAEGRESVAASGRLQGLAPFYGGFPSCPRPGEGVCAVIRIQTRDGTSRVTRRMHLASPNSPTPGTIFH